MVIGASPNKADRIIALGEAKWRSRAVGVEQLERLRRIRDLLGAGEAKLLCFPKESFTPELLGRFKAYGDVELINPSRLYGGDRVRRSPASFLARSENSASKAAFTAAISKHSGSKSSPNHSM